MSFSLVKELMAKVSQITRFPAKGLSGEELQETPVWEGVGIPGDRALAFRFADAPQEAVDKRHFLQWANTPASARLRCRFDRATDHLTIYDGEMILVDGMGPGDAARVSAAMSAWYRTTTGQSRDLILCRARYPDVPDCDLSILHLASLRDVESRLGRPIEPHRLRMNLHLEGDDPPWIERSWVGRRLRLGSALIEVMGMLPRCPAPDADPETGVRTGHLVRDLMAHYGHSYVGILARVRSRGHISLGDALTAVEDESGLPS